jgi:dipeptidyl aminopeptidase/acylaminoacyl peptidase
LRRLLYRLALYYGIICVVMAFLLARIALHPQRVPLVDVDAPAGAAARLGATFENVSITVADGAVLRAWFLKPRSMKRAVIILHGVGDNRAGAAGFGELFLSHGYGVLLPDSRGQGQSDGAVVTYGIKERDDVRRWFEWLQEREHPQCIFGMGESMGAAIILQSVEAEPHFCAVVAESAFATFQEIAFDRIGQIFHTGAWLGRYMLRPAAELALLVGRVMYGVNLADASPQAAITGSQVPILLIHGLADSNIPPRHSEQIHRMNPENTALWEVPRAEHCGASATMPEEFNMRVLGWFAEHSTER